MKDNAEDIEDNAEIENDPNIGRFSDYAGRIVPHAASLEDIAAAKERLVEQEKTSGEEH